YAAGCTFEELAACTDIIVTRDREPGSAPFFIWRKHEQRAAGGEQIQTQSPGLVVVRRAISTAVRKNPEGPDSLHFSPGDKVYTLAETADGSYDFWYHRKAWRGARFWDPRRKNRSAAAVQVQAEQTWWPTRVPYSHLESGYVNALPGLFSGIR